MKISVIGTGRWASTNIWIAVRGGHTVQCWDKFETDFLLTKKNKYVDLSNNDSVICSRDLEETLNYGEIVIISILSQELNNLM
ncbi:MAG: glycerol-3-phosphate dehydrogenase, partial [Clostridia bacterium]|nr:glycerol-3-phosphate dehydrogenase [Clostridia bacterium]